MFSLSLHPPFSISAQSSPVLSVVDHVFISTSAQSFVPAGTIASLVRSINYFDKMDFDASKLSVRTLKRFRSWIRAPFAP